MLYDDEAKKHMENQDTKIKELQAELAREKEAREKLERDLNLQASWTFMAKEECEKLKSSLAQRDAALGMIGHVYGVCREQNRFSWRERDTVILSILKEINPAPDTGCPHCKSGNKPEAGKHTFWADGGKSADVWPCTNTAGENNDLPRP